LVNDYESPPTKKVVILLFLKNYIAVPLLNADSASPLTYLTYYEVTNFVNAVNTDLSVLSGIGYITKNFVLIFIQNK
jgi:hypothetical protein